MRCHWLLWTLSFPAYWWFESGMLCERNVAPRIGAPPFAMKPSQESEQRFLISRNQPRKSLIILQIFGRPVKLAQNAKSSMGSASAAKLGFIDYITVVWFVIDAITHLTIELVRRHCGWFRFLATYSRAGLRGFDVLWRRSAARRRDGRCVEAVRYCGEQSASQ